MTLKPSLHVVCNPNNPDIPDNPDNPDNPDKPDNPGQYSASVIHIIPYLELLYIHVIIWIYMSAYICVCI